MKTIIRRIFSLFALLSAATAGAQQFVPIISHYSSFDYHMGMQNWACTEDSGGLMYFGNNNGLLSYDGYQWETVSLPSRGIVRSLMADGDRVYVGSYTDFGYFERNEFGTMVFHSLWPKGYKGHNDEIWNILKDSHGHIWFQSFSSYFCYDGKKVTTYYDKNKLPLWFFDAGGEIYVQIINGGLCRMNDGKFVTVATRDSYGDDNVTGLHPLGNGAVLLATGSHGLFLLKNGTVTPVTTYADDFMRHCIVNRTAMISKNVIAVGTIKGGVAAIDLSTGSMLWHYDKHSGLGNNTVLGLCCGRGGNLWVALDNGLSLVHTGLPVSVARMDGVGMVYGMASTGDAFYIGTNQALWRWDRETEMMGQVPGCEGQNWYVERLNGEIFVGNNLSLKTVAGTEATNLSSPAVGSTALREYNLFGQHALIESTYSSFHIYLEGDDGWHNAGEIKGFSAPVREFEIDSRGVIWAAHMSKGMYRLELSRDLKRFVSTKYYPSLEGGVEQMFHVLNICGRVVFVYGDKLYTYDDIKSRMVPYDALGEQGKNGAVAAAMVDKNMFWLLDNDGYWLMQDNGKGAKPNAFIPSTIFGQECNIYGRSMFVDGHYTYFFLNDGLGRYDLRRSAQTDTKCALRIAEVSTKDSENNEKLLPLAGNCSVAGNLTVRVSYPNYDGDRIIFHYSLSGGTSVDEDSASPEVSFTNLAYGNYKLTVSVRSVDGKALGSVTYGFSYSRPFYNSIWAWILYVLALAALIYFYARWHTAREVSRNKKMVEEELMKQKMKALEQDRIIAEQQKVILENELTDKSKDVASMALDMVAMKNSMESVREQLLEGMRNGTLSSKNANRILQQLKEGDNDMFWSTYHTNFDLIHKRFFRNLHERYPELTSNDLKICALLRLNLNTKDIASFTHLSVRGVEGARYRIRKKLGLPSDKSLTDFLLEF